MRTINVHLHMKWLASFAILAAASMALAQSAPTPYRFRVRHADPWMIKAILEGRPVFTPEVSALFAFTGGGATFSGPATNALIQNGRLIVNPTDNSIWFIPDQRR